MKWTPTPLSRELIEAAGNDPLRPFIEGLATAIVKAWGGPFPPRGAAAGLQALPLLSGAVAPKDER